MFVHSKISTKTLNTFGINVTAKMFSRCSSLAELKELVECFRGELPILIIGGGSNILFTKDFEGIIIRNELEGIEVVKEDEQHVYVKAEGGVKWHDFVLYCIENNYAGVENLSLIPGSVGASPIQNIGAYGVEIKDVFQELTAYNLETNEILNFKYEDCHFGYRDSVFKHEYKDKLFILDVTYKLDKEPNFKTSYGDIESWLAKNNIRQLTIKAVSDAVIAIRKEKLPNPEEVGNAGSFFKNPVIDKKKFDSLIILNDKAPHYQLDEHHYKIPAAWLIEQCGWKGKSEGKVGCHAKQPLVLLNLGGAEGKDIYNFSQQIIESVETRFGIRLEREVNIL